MKHGFDECFIGILNISVLKAYSYGSNDCIIVLRGTELFNELKALTLIFSKHRIKSKIILDFNFF